MRVSGVRAIISGNNLKSANALCQTISKAMFRSLCMILILIFFFLSRAVFNYLLFKGLARPLNDGMTKGTARFSRTHELYSKRQQHNDQRKSDSRLFIRPVEMCNTENVGSLYHFD